MMKKKIISIMLGLSMTVVMLAGCGDTKESEQLQGATGEIDGTGATKSDEAQEKERHEKAVLSNDFDAVGTTTSNVGEINISIPLVWVVSAPGPDKVIYKDSEENSMEFVIEKLSDTSMVESNDALLKYVEDSCEKYENYQELSSYRMESLEGYSITYSYNDGECYDCRGLLNGFIYNNTGYLIELRYKMCDGKIYNSDYTKIIATIQTDEDDSATDFETGTEQTGANQQSYPTGMYKIGGDMPAGEYLITTTSPFAYMEVATDSSGELNSIVSNDNFSNRIYITVSDGQYLKFDGRAVIASGAPAYETQNGVYGDGMYLVGKDIPAGEYKISVSSTASLGYGYFELSGDSSGTLESIITNENIQADTYQTIEAGQYLKLSGAQIVLQ